MKLLLSKQINVDWGQNYCDPKLYLRLNSKWPMGFWQVYTCCWTARYLGDGSKQGILRVQGKSDGSLNVALLD